MFCAVIAVIAVMGWPPSIATVLMSAWMPAPPPESEPATIRMRGGGEDVMFFVMPGQPLCGKGGPGDHVYGRYLGVPRNANV